MSGSGDLIDFDVIENQKENIQSLPGGRSARALAQIFSSGSKGDKYASPSPNDTRTLNDAIRQEYEAELANIAESDDPLDIYDRYVKWTLNAYPSAQATPESGLLPLLERATKSFLSSPHYKNDPRYLRLWLHYIRLFSDSPRETFAFLARHHIGEGLALFYEEFAAWLESAGRWTQAEEVYKLGLQREARPAERLLRKYNEFQKRFEQRPQGADGPSSPALPTVRPALAAKVDPFSSASAASPAPDPQQSQRARSGIGGGSTTRSGKPKMTIYSDADAGPANQPVLSGQTKGWESIGSFRDRKKENTMEARPWVGETLKAGKKPKPVEKLTIYKDESSTNSGVQESVKSNEVPEHHVREAVNPRTGRRERVFVNLEAVYPDYRNPTYEMSFEELRAMSRGWLDKDWRLQKKPLKEISGNAPCRDPSPEYGKENIADKALAAEVNRKLAIEERHSQPVEAVIGQEENRDNKSGKARRTTVREIKGETQIIKLKLDSPTGPRVKRKEPTMTFHTRAATDEIYSIFNQPLQVERANAAESVCGSDYEDDDYTSAGESTATGRISATSSEFGDNETNVLGKTHDKEEEEDEDEEGDYEDETRVESVGVSEWTEFSPSKHVPKVTPHDTEDVPPEDTADIQCTEDLETSADDSDRRSRRERFIPQMPEDYNPPTGPYREPVANRLPFMTPILERTECSFPSMTAARNNVYDAKTPCKPMQADSHTPPGMPQVGDLLLSSPCEDVTTPKEKTSPSVSRGTSPSPAKKLRPSPEKGRSSKNILQRAAIIKDAQCNPTDPVIRNTILKSLDPPLSSYPGYNDHTNKEGNFSAEIQRFAKALTKRPKSGDKVSFTPPVLSFPGADREYTIRRELGAGAFAPVYLAESVDSVQSDAESEIINEYNKRSLSLDKNRRPRQNVLRQGLEAIKMEIGPPNPWEFYIIRTAHDRLRRSAELSRAAESIVRVHEIHLFKDETFLVEDYRAQGTLLDLVNVVRNEGITANGSAEAGLDEALAMFFTVELFRTVEALHACGILHGDIKPDNCLVRLDEKSSSSTTTSTASLLDLEEEELADPREVHYSPRGLYNWRDRGLTLIDFGRGIDMRAFQPSVQFIADWETGAHECNEMREMRPWTHQIDLYGIAGTVHVMLFGKYIESVPVRGNDGVSPNGRRDGPVGSPSAGSNRKRYRIRESLKRYWDREIWNDVFDLLLNPGADRWVEMERSGGASAGPNPNGAILPVLHSMRHVREKMEAWLLANAEKKNLLLQIRKLEAHFAKRKEKLEK